MTTKNIYNPLTSYPNQLHGRIHKPKYKERKVKFMYVGIDEIRAAAKDLSPSALKLYLYFVENEEGWEFNLSPKDFQNCYSVSESTYRNAKKELVEKGYIVQTGNNFTFYSNPKDAEVSLDDIKKEMNRIGGHIKEYSMEQFNMFYDEVAKLSNLNENQKKTGALDVLKRMRATLDKLEEENNSFNF